MILIQIFCRAHEAANEARKLTPAARRDKTIRKLNEDTSLGVHVSLYQVKDLHHPQKQYKVDVNARQLYMTGNGRVEYGREKAFLGPLTKKFQPIFALVVR